MIEIYTVGVYGSTEENFFNKLKDSGIDLFCDIRQRRGVRGAQYKYVNSKYLQEKLKKIGIKYLYEKELAPTKEIRERQKEADKHNGENKRTRTELGEVFRDGYVNDILRPYNLDSLLDKITEAGAKRVVFFCVEEKPEACHRSIVAKAIAEKAGGKVENL